MTQQKESDMLQNIMEEKSVEKYFPEFEKVAENLKWQRNVWSTMLHSVLIGKTAEVYSALGVAEISCMMSSRQR